MPDGTVSNGRVQHWTWRLSQFFDRWQPRLLLSFYCALLILALVIPWFTDAFPWLSVVQQRGIPIATVGMIGLLLRPFFSLVAYVADTRNKVSAVHQRISQLRTPRVSVAHAQGIEHVRAAVTTHASPDIFLGFKDPTTVRTVVDAFRTRQSGRLYVSPGALDVLVETLETDGKLPDPTRTFVTDCPRESCAIFASDDQRQTHCIIFRYMPRHNIDRPDQYCWSATVTPGSEYAQYLHSMYDRHYGGRSSTSVTSPLKARLLCQINNRRIEQNRELIAGRLSVMTRPLSYVYVTSLIKHAQRSINAVDFMSPWLWKKTDGLVFGYLQAHREVPSGVTKRRIHAFDANHVTRDAEAYRRLIRIHKDLGVDLRFIEEGLVYQVGVYRGFVIVDDEILFVSDDLHAFSRRDTVTSFTIEDLEDVQFRAESGLFDFRDEELRRCKDQFAVLQGKSATILLDAEAFRTKYLESSSEQDIGPLLRERE